MSQMEEALKQLEETIKREQSVESATVKVRLINSNKKNWILTWLPIILSISSFFLSLFPQINPLNRDYIARANAGDTTAQMFLAEHYYTVGDIKESDYWYKIATMTPGDQMATALNNVAYLALTYHYSIDNYSDYRLKAVQLFKNAAMAGNRVALQNLYVLLEELERDHTVGIDVKRETIWAIRVSYYYDVTIEGVRPELLQEAITGCTINLQDAYTADTAVGGVKYMGYDDIFPLPDAFVKHDKTNYISYVYWGK